MIVGIYKKHLKTLWIDQKCMLFDMWLSGDLLLTKGKAHITKMQKMGPFAGRSKNKPEPGGPLQGFWEAKMGPGAHFRIREGPV